MPAQRIQTTYTFTHAASARVFARWLRVNCCDRDYGYPNLLDHRQVGKDEFLVEYSYDNTKAGHLTRGVAVGMEFLRVALDSGIDVN